jgi:nitroreductase
VVGLRRIGEIDQALKRASALPGFDHYRDFVGQPSYSVNFRKAPVFLVVGSDRKRSFCPVKDGTLVLGNILLAAHALGLGAVWVNQVGSVADEPGFRKVLTGLGFPETHAVVGCAAVGRPEGPSPQAPPRIPGRHNVVAG